MFIHSFIIDRDLEYFYHLATVDAVAMGQQFMTVLPQTHEVHIL